MTILNILSSLDILFVCLFVLLVLKVLSVGCRRIIAGMSCDLKLNFSCNLSQFVSSLTCLSLSLQSLTSLELVEQTFLD